MAGDPATGDLGTAVQSKFLAVGSVVPWAPAGAGAIATRSWANPGYGPAGFQLLAGGRSAAEVLDELLRADEGRDFRQVGIVDAAGRSAGFTGQKCILVGDVRYTMNVKIADGSIIKLSMG